MVTPTTSTSAAGPRAPRESTDLAGRSALDLHEGIGPPQGSKGCPRWPAGLRLESTLGDLVPGRCRATNLCDYCARLAAVENAEVLALDALTNSAPGLWSVLTTRTATIETGRFKHAREATTRAVRRRWPDAESATLIEFTTGLGKNAGGDRRPHWNDTWKGIPIEDGEELHRVLSTAWCDRVDGLPRAQHVQPISETGGLMRYLALHFQKESQQPPEGWRGHRFRTTRGYLGRPMVEARTEARSALRWRRELWKAHRDGLVGEEAEQRAQRAVYDARELAWSLVRLQALPTAFGEDGLPASWTEVVLPV